MKTIEIHSDLNLAPAKPSFAGYAAIAGTRLLQLFRAVRHRRQVMRLEDFTDAQLDDIGLSRRDLYKSLATRWFEDPSQHLAHSASSRRTRSHGRRSN